MAQQQKADAFETRRADVREHLKHKISQMEHDKKLKRHVQTKEATEMQRKLDEYEAELQAKVNDRKDKVSPCQLRSWGSE